MSMSASVSGNDRVVFGTAAISAAEDPYHVLDAAFEKGVRRFDLARTYGLGKSETIFGEWMESRYVLSNVNLDPRFFQKHFIHTLHTIFTEVLTVTIFISLPKEVWAMTSMEIQIDLY